jgi:hypothetical protein
MQITPGGQEGLGLLRWQKLSGQYSSSSFPGGSAASQSAVHTSTTSTLHIILML